MASDPFRTPAERVCATGHCARCGAEVPRADLVFAVDGTLRCRACETPLPVPAPLPHAALPLRFQVAISVGMFLAMTLLEWLGGHFSR